MIERIICIAIGYLFGLIQTGYLVGKLKGIDIREHGSGNSGTTNTLRTMGLKYGLIVLAGDAVKCGLSILVVHLIYSAQFAIYMPIFAIYAATGTILGHNFPIHMKFKGGKGFAATAGFVIFGLGWKMTLICLAIFLLVFFTTHYVSLGAIIIYITLLVSAFFYWKYDVFDFTVNGIPQCYYEYFIIMVFLAIMIIIRHKENIKRLVSGTERKTYLKGKPEIDVKALNSKESD